MVRTRVKRFTRLRGRPPGYVRLEEHDARELTRKWEMEAETHWIREYVDPGPPLRVFDLIVVIDRRRDRPGRKDVEE